MSKQLHFVSSEHLKANEPFVLNILMIGNELNSGKQFFRVIEFISINKISRVTLTNKYQQGYRVTGKGTCIIQKTWRTYKT